MRVGRSDVALDRRLARLLASEETLILTSDTLVEAGDTVPTSVLVLDATLVLEGVVAGDLVAVDGGLWVRASSRVEGDLVNIGGGLYRYGAARVGGRIFDLPDAPYHVNRAPLRVEIVAREAPVRFKLDGAFGLRMLRYDRVDGVSLDWGAGYILPLLGAVQPEIHGWVGWRTQRGEMGGGADLELRVGATVLEGGWERTTRSPDTWVRGTNLNSLDYLWDGDDFRNHYQADRVFAELRHELGDERKRFHARFGLGVQIEDALSLPAGAPWTIFGDTVRSNPAIDDGRITSGLASVTTTWSGLLSVLQTGALLEAGRTTEQGDFEFDRFEAWGVWAVKALASHTLQVSWRVQGPLPGTDSLPRQRWSLVGGRSTLQTYDIAAFHGDRVAFVRTDYVIPFPGWLALPLLGAPDLHLIHAAGRAWTAADTETDLEQNVGGELRFTGVYIRYMVDPSGITDNSLVVGLVSPFAEPYPWQR